MEQALPVVALIVVMLVVPWLLASASRSTRSTFTSGRERRLWLWLCLVLTAIYATLGVAQPLVVLLRERALLQPLGLVLLLALGLALLTYAIRWRPSGREIGVLLGVASVYVMAAIRITIPEERTHLFEYGLVAILLHEALLERRRHGRRVPAPAALAFALATLLGWVDEAIQSMLPNRVYDLRDVGFNALAACMAIASSLLLAFVRRRAARGESPPAGGPRKTPRGTGIGR